MIGRNNPWNVRYNPLNRWKGLEGETKGFCNFRSLFYGFRAAFYLISVSYKKKGFTTYAQIINRYAPPSENNSSAYLGYICNKLDVFPFDVPKTKGDWLFLMYYMSKYEGNPVSLIDIHHFYYRFENEG